MPRHYCPACREIKDPHACYFRQSLEGDLQEEIGALIDDARLLMGLQGRFADHERRDAFHLQMVAEELLREAARRVKTLAHSGEERRANHGT